MRKPEQRFWDHLHNNKLIHGDVHRIENKVELGTPDVVACYKGTQVWIELKVGKPNQLLTLIREEQFLWHIMHTFKGEGRVFVLLRYMDSINAYQVINKMAREDRYVLRDVIQMGQMHEYVRKRLNLVLFNQIKV
jgi:Holliday junction resolvase